MSKYSEIRSDLFDEEEDKLYIDAWMTDEGEEEGAVIAKISAIDGSVEYLDEDAKEDPWAQEVITEELENLKKETA